MIKGTRVYNSIIIHILAIVMPVDKEGGFEIIARELLKFRNIVEMGRINRKRRVTKYRDTGSDKLICVVD
jgi:hypothetical protein